MSREEPPATPSTISSIGSISTALATPIATPMIGTHGQRRRSTGAMLASPLSTISSRGAMPVVLQSPGFSTSAITTRSRARTADNIKKKSPSYREFLLKEKDRLHQEEKSKGPRMGREPLSIFDETETSSHRRRKFSEQRINQVTIKSSTKMKKKIY
mmetsp:Transcript_64/g.100  ORF Transcript_64/g.100 Transcript_64/m.100 type:complete len:157 (-) Transcript_64:5-475(-)